MALLKNTQKKRKVSQTQITPYIEPHWHSTPSPYYNASHYAFQKKIREFVNKVIYIY